MWIFGALYNKNVIENYYENLRQEKENFVMRKIVLRILHNYYLMYKIGLSRIFFHLKWFRKLLLAKLVDHE
jgi:hypothetical protein